MLPDNIRISYVPYRLRFKEPGGTSRGILTEKLTFFIRIANADDPSMVGYGEVPFFPGLSKELPEELEAALRSFIAVSSPAGLRSLSPPSSLVFGLEQACSSFGLQGKGLVFPSPFTEGRSGIEINGLIWMGSPDVMRRRVEEKLEQGFRCIKIKIGAIDWEEELNLIRFVRRQGGPALSIRVDANGAFSPADCLPRLNQLADLGVHSIEQPVRQGNLEAMKRLCAVSPVPIALDEELIGIPVGPERSRLLDFVRPQFLILKPALCFGFTGALDWIRRAAEMDIGWWITSALESSVGLDAIAQFTGSLGPSLPQGLGTGNLFTNNFASPLRLSSDRLSYTGSPVPYASELESLDWIGL